MPHLMHRLLPALALALGVAACGNDDGGPITPPAADGGGEECLAPTFSAIHEQVLLSGRCVACHGSAGGLDFSAGKGSAYEALVGAASANPAATSPTRVVAGDPAASWFYAKVAEANPPDGRMPLAGSPLTACELEAIRAWIEAGAAND
jgi:mono/diheme cytochrome c family protein